MNLIKKFITFTIYIAKFYQNWRLSSITSFTNQTQSEMPTGGWGGKVRFKQDLLGQVSGTAVLDTPAKT